MNKDASWTPSKNSRICSLHFAEGDIVLGRKLRPGAMPVSRDFVQVQTDHNYAMPKPSIVSESISTLQSKIVNLRKRKSELECQVNVLEKAIHEEKNDLSDQGYYDILSKAQQIPAAIIGSYCSKMRKISSDKCNEGFRAQKAYSKEIQEFAMMY